MGPILQFDGYSRCLGAKTPFRLIIALVLTPSTGDAYKTERTSPIPLICKAKTMCMAL